ncbi:MAG: protein-glutamate methylesterase/protein-glutamine glutaminase [Pseudomonadota bacterium]
MNRPPVRVLAVDDSAVARSAYRFLLTPELGFDLVATAPNADIARRKIEALDPDVVVLDIEMPGEDGLSFLQWLMRNRPTPVVVCSVWSSRGAEQTMRAFALGAIDVVCKGTPGEAPGWGSDFADTLADAVRAAAGARNKMLFRGGRSGVEPPVRAAVRRSPVNVPIRRGHCVVIGASTGGTEALATLFAQMPADFPPTFVVQHMPPLYTQSFARRLDTLGDIRVREAVDGAQIGPGEALVAPGGKQLRMAVGHAGPVARIGNDGPVNRHAPSVDVLFLSAVESYHSRVIGVLLTGMGNDGARGLLRIRETGGRTVAQDEATSVVFGMPQEAIKLGAAAAVLPIQAIVPHILEALASS